MRNPEKSTAPNQSPATPVDYVERVNRAIDHITTNLDGDLRLETVADAACFSPFHFHRIFRAVTGETLAQFVKRVRLERALYLMSHDRPRTLTEIALACGFASSSDFSRSFRRRYGVAPSGFDLAGWRTERRRDLESIVEIGGDHVDRLPVGANPDGFEVTIRRLPPRTMAYIRVLNPYHGRGVPDAADRLLAWAATRGVGDRPWYGYQWEDPEIVPLEQCRYDVAVGVGDVEPDGEIGRADFPAMTVAEVRMDGPIDMEMRLLDWIFTTWLPTSGYAPDDQPCFEAWHGRPFAHGFERFRLAIQLPVRRT